MVKVKRIYEKPEESDGYRILVDRLWPRGVSKEKAALNLWLKDIAPSNELRKWYNHEPEKWPQFQKKYQAEIAANKEVFEQLKEVVKKEKNVTLLYATREEKRNEAQVLKDLL